MIIGIAGIPALVQNYKNALFLAAALSGIAVEAEVSLQPEKTLHWDGLILPGGGDIDPALLPGGPPPDPHCRDIDPSLDRSQLSLLDRFVHEKKPVLGICKGMQLIALYFGYGFCQHLPTADRHRYIQYDQLHPSHAEAGSFLAALYGEHFMINSAHHQGILLPGSGDPVCPHSAPLRVIQTANDGVAEGIVHRTLPVIGLQWHPERLCGHFARQDAVDGSLLFQYFLSLCRRQLPGE